MCGGTELNTFKLWVATESLGFLNFLLFCVLKWNKKKKKKNRTRPKRARSWRSSSSSSWKSRRIQIASLLHPKRKRKKTSLRQTKWTKTSMRPLIWMATAMVLKHQRRRLRRALKNRQTQRSVLIVLSQRSNFGTNGQFMGILIHPVYIRGI